MVRENAELGLVADFSDALARFSELYQRWRETVQKIEQAAEGADLDALEKEAEGLAKEMQDVGRAGAGAMRELADGSDKAEEEVEELRKEVDRLEGEVDKAGKEIDSFSKKGSASFGGLKTAILGIGTALAAIGIGRALRFIVEETNTAEASVAKLNATLAATEGAAGLTSEELQQIATDLQKVTTSGDEANLDMLSLLLTFKQIGGEILPEVAERVLDVAAVMGTDAQSAALQLGKALNDPVLGVQALNRVGIQFSEDQKKVIKALVDSGDVAGAQAVILKELEGQVGGVARAMRNTLPGAITAAQNALGDLAEKVGQQGLTREMRLAAESVTLFAEESEHGTSAAEGLGTALGAAVRGVTYVVTSYSRARAVMASFFSTIIGGAATAADAILRFAQTTIRGVEGLVDAMPGGNVLFRGFNEGADKAVAAIGRLREGGVKDLQFLAESYEEVAIEQNIVADQLAEKLEKLRKELDTAAPAARTLGEASEDGAEGLRNLGNAAAGALDTVKALADAASEPLDFTEFGPGAEDAAKRAEGLADESKKLREEIEELEGVPNKTAEQLVAMFEATDKLTVVERNLTAALEEAAPILKGGTSLVEDYGLTAQKSAEYLEQLAEKGIEQGVVTREQAEAAGLLAKEQERVTLATERQPQAFAELSQQIDQTGIEVRDLNKEQTEQLKTTGDINTSLEGMKSRLDNVGAAQAESAKTSREALAEQVEGWDKLDEKQKASIEGHVVWRKAVEVEMKKADTAMATVARRWQELNRLCDAHKECLTS